MVFFTPTILSLTSRFNPRKSRKVLTIPWSKDGAQIGHGNPHETGAHTIKLSTVVALLWLLFFEQFLDMMIGYDVGRHGMKDNYMIMRRRYKLILPGFNISIPRIFFLAARESCLHFNGARMALRHFTARNKRIMTMFCGSVPPPPPLLESGTSDFGIRRAPAGSENSICHPPTSQRKSPEAGG